MRRTRAALIAGNALLALSCLVGCCLPAVLVPRSHWLDPAARQAAGDHALGWLFGTGAVLFLGGYLLLAHAWLSRRMERLEADDSSDDATDWPPV
ncbi:hypothetical protein ACNTMW_07355 [Planosporangium sp. 12N6]|uniref:hypothetical protein n=1 Tax=Planosporangium spinosum TaxID=3402278 RepID=UPI003CE73E9D